MTTKPQTQISSLTVSSLPKLHLRPLDLERDLEHIMNWVNDPTIVSNFGWFDGKVTREKEKKYLEKMLASTTDRLYSVVDDQGTYVGQAGIHEIDYRNKHARFGLIITNKEDWSKGYGQNIVDALLGKAFGELNMHKVWGMFVEQNTKAFHLFVEKCGFRVEGVLQEEYFRDGKYHPMVRIGMTENENVNAGWRKVLDENAVAEVS